MEEGIRRQVVAFRLCGEIYAIDILRIQEVLHLRPITPIPNAPPFIDGLIELRGRVIPVVDLKRRLGLNKDNTAFGRILVVDLAGKLLGLLVDDVYKVLQLGNDSLEDVPDAVVHDRVRNCLSCLAKTEQEGLIILLATEKILNAEETEHVERLADEGAA